jgi:hypothetical protein
MKQKAISWEDFENYGCVNCGCEFAYSQGVQDTLTNPVECGECKTNFVILSSGVVRSSIGFSLPRKPGMSQEVYYPFLEVHPRKGTSKRPYVRPDIRPETGGEYFEPRRPGYDLAGFVKCKQAGERIVAMFAGALGKEPKTYLDYREKEPDWIQVKVHKEEADVDKLYELTKETGIITAEIISNIVKRSNEYA